MSTKTTFKRLALVTVAAMGFGLLSAVPSTATTQNDTLTLSAATSTIAAGSSGSITLTQGYLGVSSDTMSVTVSLTSGPATNAAMPVITETTPTNRVGGASPSVSSDGLTSLITDTGSVTAYHLSSADFKVTFSPTVAGTYVFTFTPYNMTSSTARSTVAPRAAAVTWTVTVPAGTVADTTSTIVTRANGVTTGSAATISVAAGSSTAQVASIEVTPLIASVATTGSTIITATVTGPGTVGVGTSAITASTGLKTATYNGVTATATNYVTLWGDGTTGTSSIAISINGTAVGTATAKFTGAVSTVTATLAKPVIAAGSTATTGVITIVAKDANGNGVSGSTFYAVSSGSSIVSTSVTTGSAGAASISLVGSVAGTNTVTIQNVAAGSTATISAAALSVRVGSATESSVTMTLDKATYAPGDQATITVTIKDAAGLAVVDGTYAAFAADVTSTRAMSSGTLPTASITVGSTVGVKTYLVNVPNSEGAFTISALPGAGMLGAGSAVAVSATATVTPSAATTAANDIAQAAADAAAEATDAANAATDAANAAAEAADAATAAAQDAADAVAALSTQVAELISGLKAQLTALTNLVIKIQKKVKA